MTSISGYLITADADVALELCGTDGVRYAARLSDGRGFAAFDADRVRAFELGAFGQILNEVEADPNNPDTWPDFGQKGPKRHVATGDERFILYAVPRRDISANAALDYFVQIYEPRAAALVWDGAAATFYVLIEDGPDWRGPEDAVWDCTTTEHRDVRIGVPA